MLRNTVTMVRKNADTSSFKPAMKYTMPRNITGRMRSSGRSLEVLAIKYALSLYISTDLSFASMALS